MKSKKNFLAIVYSLVVVLCVLTSCGGSKKANTFASSKRTIAVDVLNEKANFKNVRLYDEISQSQVTISGTVLYRSGFQTGSTEIIIICKGEAYCAKTEISKDLKTFKIQYNAAGKMDTYKKK